MSNAMRFVTDLGKGILGQSDSTDLWTEIVSHIPDDVLLKQDVKILNVAFGHGTEADIIAQRMLALGRSAEDVKKAIYLVDKYHVFTNRAVRKGYTNVITADFLEWEPNMKFDVVIGNPPYQGSNDKGTKQPKSHNLWSKFVDKGIDLLKNDGYIAYVTPDSWMSPNSQILKTFKEHSLIWVDTKVGRYFTVGSSFSAWIMQKNKSTTSAMIDQLHVDLSTLQYLPREFAHTYPIHNKVVNSVHPKLSVQCDMTCHSDHKHANLSDTKDSTYKFETFHTNAQTKFSKKQSKDFAKPKIIWTTSGYFKPFFNPGNLGTTEVCQYILVNNNDASSVLSYLNSKLYKFIINSGKWSGFLNGKVLSSLPALDTRVWTDADLYQHFGLTQEEIDYVEANVK